MPVAVSLRMRLGLVVGLGVTLLIGSAAAMAGMRREYRARLVERAQFEAERALDRLEAPGAPAALVEECSVGETRAGVAPLESTVLGDLDPAAAARTRASLSSPGRVDVEMGFRRGMPFVLATRARSGGRVAWATVDVAEAHAVRFWKGVAASLVAVFAALLYIAVDTLRRLHRASRTLVRATEALASDLRAPIPAPGVAELVGVTDGLRSLSRALEQTRHDRETLTAALSREQRLGALGRVVAAIAHEVRNPLAAIKLRADLAREGGSEEDRRRDLEVLGQEVDRLGRLLTHLLAHTRGAEPTPHDVGAIALERVESATPWARERDVTLRFAGTGAARADVDALGRALDNLIRNAVEASPPGGQVDVEVRSGGDRLEVRVSDEGPGVPPERVIELFEPFFTTKPRGTGLGLSLARATLRAHGGDVEYHRQPGRTCFTMRLPLEQH